MNVVKDAFQVLGESFRKTVSVFRYIPILALCLFVYTAIRFVSSLLLARVGLGIPFLRGFLLYLVSAALLAHLAGIMNNIILYDRLNQRMVFDFSLRFFPDITRMMFVLYIVEILVSQLSLTLGIYELIHGLLFLLLSPAFEFVYQDRAGGFEILSECLRFNADNLLSWVPFNLLITLILLRGGVISQVVPGIAMAFIASLLGSFILVWKGHLFYILANSNPRKREFQRKF